LGSSITCTIFILLKSNRLNILNNTLWVWTSVFSYSYVDSDFYTATIEKFAKGVRELHSKFWFYWVNSRLPLSLYLNFISNHHLCTYTELKIPTVSQTIAPFGLIILNTNTASATVIKIFLAREFFSVLQQRRKAHFW
jgi:hypothetical protein